MKTRMVFYICILLLSHATFLSAQFNNSEFGIGLLVGGSKLQGDVENTNMGLTGGLMLKYVPTSRLALTALAAYGQMTTGLNAIKTDLLSTSLLASLFILPNNNIRPFLSIGLSRFHYSTKKGNGQQLYRNNGSPISAWKSALQFGVGVELFTGKRWAINTMGNYNITRVDELDAITGGASDGFFHGFIGLVHYFKTGKDTEDEKLSLRNYQQTAPIEEKSMPESNLNSTAQNAPSDQFANGIYFERGSANLLAKSRHQLHEIYRYLDTHPDEELELLGVTGANQSENKLILERANAVKAYLVNLGIKSEKIIIKAN
ncbi:outer membrane beta-barrel protein [candidate division KSB1 bacterium]|nr:outer membrane beta-barrel protein [candidate division KSB1 bacterium]